MTSLGGKIEKAFVHHFLAFHCSSDRCSSDDYTSDQYSKGSCGWPKCIVLSSVPETLFMHVCVLMGQTVQPRLGSFLGICVGTPEQSKTNTPLSLSLEYLSDQITRPAYQ